MSISERLNLNFIFKFSIKGKMMKKVYMILGPKRSGKDHVGSVLTKELGCESIAFADDIKTIIAETFDITQSELDILKNSNSDVYADRSNSMCIHMSKITNFRKIIQNYGQVIKKLYGKKFWAHKVVNKIYTTENSVVITDLRYNIEYKVVSKHYDVLTIRILNDDLEDNDSHSSENEMKNFKADIILDNTGYKLTKEEIIRKVIG